MKAAFAFIFFMLFLAGIAFVNLKGAQEQSAATPADVSVSAWRPTHIGEMRLDDDGDMFVQFEADGQVSGHGGCNRFFGTYELANGALQIGALGSTRMACAEPAMSFELAFLEALQSPSATTLVADKLIFRIAQDEVTLRFVAIDKKAEN